MRPDESRPVTGTPAPLSRSRFRARRLPALPALLFLGLAILSSAPETPGLDDLAPEDFLRFTGGEPPGRIPYPEVWDPNPLRFPYTAAESLYLPPAPVPDRPPVRLGTFAPPPGTGKTIRVLIQPQTRALRIRAGERADIQWRMPDGRVRRAPSLAGELRVERRDGRFRIVPAAGATLTGDAASALRVSPFNPENPLEVNGKAWRGAIEIHAEGPGFVAVNTLPLEDYLRGVVPLEMGRHDETRMEALKAQAVTARTYALKRALARAGEAFDVHASVQDQVYGGAAAEHGMSDRAVRATAGVVLLHGDSLAHTYYHSTCGGATASRHEVWGGEPVPYLISAPDTDSEGRAWCRASRYMDWSQTWDAAALAGIVRANLAAAGVRDAPDFRGIRGFTVRGRFSDDRIRLLEILTDRGPIELRGDKTRWALKPAPGTGRILESARFDIELNGSRVTAGGSGFGHGIGMCQMGALARAQAGQNYAAILSAYYPGTGLGRLDVR